MAGKGFRVHSSRGGGRGDEGVFQRERGAPGLLGPGGFRGVVGAWKQKGHRKGEASANSQMCYVTLSRSHHLSGPQCPPRYMDGEFRTEGLARPASLWKDQGGVCAGSSSRAGPG